MSANVILSKGQGQGQGQVTKGHFNQMSHLGYVTDV